MLDDSLFPRVICPRMRAIMVLFTHDGDLLDLLFHKDRQRLRLEPESLRIAAGTLSSGQRVLVEIALDLWDGVGEVHLWDLLGSLDGERFKVFIQALMILRQ